MKNLALSRLALILILIVILFAFLTQRILLSTYSEESEQSNLTLKNILGKKLKNIIPSKLSSGNESILGQIVTSFFVVNENEESSTVESSNEELKKLLTKDFNDIDDILEKEELKNVSPITEQSSVIVNQELLKEQSSLIANEELTSVNISAAVIPFNVKSPPNISFVDPDEVESVTTEAKDKVYEFDELLKSNTTKIIESSPIPSTSTSSSSSRLNLVKNPTVLSTSIQTIITEVVPSLPSISQNSAKISSYETVPKTESFLNKESGSFLNKKRPPKDSDPIQLISTEELQNIQISRYHPLYSPRNGTDISASNQFAVLMCPNQSKCIVPELQLKVKYKIYMCKHPTKQGVRFYFLTREGLLLHPNVEMVTDISTADYVVYLPGSAPWHLSECTNVSLKNKLIVLDEFDGSTLYWPPMTSDERTATYGPSHIWYFVYFKRSFVKREDGRFIGYPSIDFYPDVYPLTYSIAEAYVQPNKFSMIREIDILCTLRGSKLMTTRQRVSDWVKDYGATRKVENIVTQQLSTATRTQIDRMYFERMYNTRIIVTVNPAGWEGDFRLWESLATGALVFVDHLNVLHPFPLVGGEHIVYYSNGNKSELFEKLDFYRSHPEEARRVAINGYLHAMKYHRTVSMLDYVLRSVHLREATLRGDPVLPDYRDTAQELNVRGRVIQRFMREQERLEKERLRIEALKSGLIKFG